MKVISNIASSLLLILSSISYISSYSFTESELLSNPNCAINAPQQSPINIIASQSVYYEETNFRIAHVNYTLPIDTAWKVFPTERAIGFEETFGSLTFINNWSMYKFDLQKILFRTKSAHRVNGQYYDVEVQFIHKLDRTYHGPGRFIYPTVDYLVVSTFMVADSDTASKHSQLFSYLNLSGYTASTWKTTRKVKLGELVRGGAEFLYEGRLEYGACNKAWVVVDPKFQTITPQELNTLMTVIKDKGVADVNGENKRNIQATQTVVYRNTESTTPLLQIASYSQYTSSQSVQFSMFVFIFSIIALLFI